VPAPGASVALEEIKPLLVSRYWPSARDQYGVNESLEFALNECSRVAL